VSSFPVTIDAGLLRSTSVGAEKRGVADVADANIVIPMFGMVQSLNVSVAATILFEAQRQRLVAGMYDAPQLAPALDNHSPVVASCWSARWLQRFPVAGGLNFRPPATQFLATS